MSDSKTCSRCGQLAALRDRMGLCPDRLLAVMTFLIALMLWVIGLLMRFGETGEGRVVTPAPCQQGG